MISPWLHNIELSFINQLDSICVSTGIIVFSCNIATSYNGFVANQERRYTFKFYYLLREKNPQIATSHFDCQKNYGCTKVPDQACYFSMQINLYHFAVATVHSKSEFDPKTVKWFISIETDIQKCSVWFWSFFFPSPESSTGPNRKEI